jgi:hypothetical protein
VHLAYTPEQQALSDELRAYFAGLMTDEVRANLKMEGGETFRQVLKQMGADGWLGLGWPKEYGGQGRPPTDQFIFFDEAQRAQAPIPFVTLNTVGPTLIQFGSEEQKATFLPPILAGELTFAIGYTEPESGTDLASLQTKAERDGDEWIINGQKIFTSGADDADYVWLACRTNTEVKKHKGISLIIVPTDTPGFSWNPLVTVGGVPTTSTFYDDVRVPYGNLVSGENEGWKLITTQLNHERIGLSAVSAFAFRLYDEVVEWAASTPASADAPEADTLIDVPWVQTELAQCHAELEAIKLMNWQLASAVAGGTLKPADASAVKVFGTEALIRIYHRLQGIVGPVGYVDNTSPGAVLRGRLEQASRRAQINTFGGGVNEIQREIVAWMGLGLTRTSR